MEQYEYGPFGEVVKKTGAADELPFGFSTKYQDTTGLLYYGRRYYNPESTKWICRDPKQESGGVNLYAALQNNPITIVDPLGLLPCSSSEKYVCKAKCANDYPGALSSENCSAWQIKIPLMCTIRLTACNCQCSCQYITRYLWPADPTYSKCYYNCPGFGAKELKILTSQLCEGESLPYPATVTTDCAAIKGWN